MQVTLRRPHHVRTRHAVRTPGAAAKPRLEGTRATLRALGSASLTLIGVHRH